MIPDIVLNLPNSYKMVDILRDCFKNSDEAAICVSFIRFSGISLLCRELNKFIERGSRLQVLTSTYLNITQPEVLEFLMGLQGIEIRLQDGLNGFHTKFYFFCNRNQHLSSYCWVGSSNLTKGGLSTNIEWNLRNTDPKIIEECTINFNLLWQREDVLPLTPEVLSNYKAKFKKTQEQAINFVLPDKNLTINNIYQPKEIHQEALRKLDEIRIKGEKSAVVIAATGLGKTFLAAFDVKYFQAQTLLFIAHKEELLIQAEETFKKLFQSLCNTGILASGKHPGNAKFVFATIQSLSHPNNKDIVEKPYDYIVIDEFHHSAASSYQTILNTLEYKFLLGLTATPERLDGHDVLEICNYNIAYEMRLPEAINRGWLVPFHYFGIADELVDYQKIKWRNGRFDPGELETALILEERVNNILKHALEKGYDGQRRATVGFCSGVRHAKYMAEAFNQRGFISEAVTGEINPDERRKIYQRFENINDSLEWLFVSDVLNEGVDIPKINSILFLRPTESFGLFLQQLGRGLRLHFDKEVLTVIDFVGHHKNAWLSLRCLHDPHSSLGVVNTEVLGIVPPKNCEIVLEEKTQEILLKIQAVTNTKRSKCQAAYERLRGELEQPPRPIDFWGREDMPSFQEFRQAFGSWLDCRVAMGDATAWELQIEKDSTLYTFLRLVETDWQAQRVTPYALLWAFSYFPDDFQQGFEKFFLKYPHWQVEKPKDRSYGKAFRTLEKKLASFFVNENLNKEIQNELKIGLDLAKNIEERILYTLATDYRLRHCGNLRKPQDLCLFAEYSRPEIINYFGVQYDPARHNSGFIQLPNNHIVIIVKLDTSGAKTTFQYKNQFLNEQHFSWQSQNRQRQDNEAGRTVTQHKQRGNILHLFVQLKSHQFACYLGNVEVVNVTGNSPMTVIFKLLQSVPEQLFKAFTRI